MLLRAKRAALCEAPMRFRCARLSRRKAQFFSLFLAFFLATVSLRGCGTHVAYVQDTFNVSTACSFIVAACGLQVSKHGDHNPISALRSKAECTKHVLCSNPALQATGPHLATSGVPISSRRSARTSCWTAKR